MFKKNNNGYLFILAIAIFMLSLLSVYASSAVTKELKLSARAAALYQPDTKSFVYTKNSDKRLHMASTTKIMTAMVALEQARDLDEAVKIDPSAVGVEGSSAYLREGDVVTVKELLYALLLQSANDAAVALACHIGGGIEGFADMMNRKVSELGLKDTHFMNPHGLDDREHYTTAHDLALIAAEAMKNEQFTEICSTYKKTIVTGDRTRTYTNHNKLLKSYDGAIGVKTGFTDESGRCLVGAAERDGLRFITVTLDAPSDWADHKAMLDLGFESMERLTLASIYEYRYELPSTIKEGKAIHVTNASELYKIVNAGKHEVKEYVNLPRFISRNIKAGDDVGYVDFYVDGEYAGQVKLVCTESVSENKKGFFEKIREWLLG